MSCRDRNGTRTKHALEDLDYSRVNEGRIRCHACGGGYRLEYNDQNQIKGWERA